jgi:hypothetical protein
MPQQASLHPDSYRSQLSCGCAVLAAPSLRLERHTAMAVVTYGTIRLRLRRQPQRLRLLPGVHTDA